MKQDTKAKIMLKIKQNKVVRTLAAPFIIFKREKMKKQFVNTSDGQYLQSLKNKFEGKRCFIIGNGPSLTIEDLNKLKNEYTFAANKILYLLDKTDWRPNQYLCTDTEGFIILQNELQKLNLESTFLNIECRKYIKQGIENVHFFYSHEDFLIKKYHGYKPEFSKNASEFVYSGHTITFVAMQLAAYMGFNEIYLLGCDHNYSTKISKDGKISKDDKIKTYAEGIPDWGAPIQYVDDTTLAYKVAREYCDSHNIKIFNATRGGKLEIFERVDFDSLFLNKTEE